MACYTDRKLMERERNEITARGNNNAKGILGNARARG